MFGKRKIFRVIKTGNPILRRESQVIPEINERVGELGEILLNIMYENNGLGLAAPQIGINLRIIALHIPKSQVGDKEQEIFPFTASPGELRFIDEMPLVFVNPKIICAGEFTSVMEEGCLSIPKVFDKVQRPASITLNAMLLSGEEVTIECGGMLARALQHEIDHLNGILFIDYFTKEQLKKHKKLLEQIEKNENVYIKRGIDSALKRLEKQILSDVS